MIRKCPHTVANRKETLVAGEKLVEYMDICHDNPVALTPLAVQRLVDAFKWHLALMAPLGLFVPKHHLMLHLTHRASFFGNPLGYATWRDEGHNRDLKRVLRNCHHRFEERAFMKLGSVLDRSKHRRLQWVILALNTQTRRDETHNDTRQAFLALVTCFPIHVNILRAGFVSSCHVACAKRSDASVLGVPPRTAASDWKLF